jgi:hypothetical protein
MQDLSGLSEIVEKSSVLKEAIAYLLGIFMKEKDMNPDVVMAAIDGVLDIVLPKLDLPPPQFVTRKIAKKIILKAIKPIVYGE